MEKAQLRFSLGIYRFEKENKIDFKIHAENIDVPNEIMLIMVKNWLKTMDGTYHERFKANSLM